VVDGGRQRVELGGAGGDVAAVNGPQCGRWKVFRQVGGEAIVEDRADPCPAEETGPRPGGHRASAAEPDRNAASTDWPRWPAVPELDYTRPWDSLNADKKRLFARMAEVYAGFLAGYLALRRRWWHLTAFATAGILLGTSCALLTALAADQFQRRHNKLQQAAGTQCLAGIPPAHRAEDRR
jgi:hypothetical protein